VEERTTDEWNAAMIERMEKGRKYGMLEGIE